MRKIRDYVDIYRRLCARNRVRSRASPWRICRFPALLCAAFLLNASACASGTASQPPPATPNAGLFSWGAELVNQTDGELFSLLKQQGLTALYQNFSSKNSRQEQMSLFAESAMKAGITVYHLTGDPYWGLDPNGEQLCEAVEEAAAYNRRIKRKFLERREEDGQKWETVPQLAGIVLDTKNFSMRAGGRTFEAAAFLRRAGADTAEVRRYFQSDLPSMIARYDIIRTAKMVHGDIAVAVAEREVSRVTAAKAADDLLTLKGVQASIVLYGQGDGISMSGRSLGEINVQVILETLGGGGNSTTAGGRVENGDIHEVRARLVDAIDAYFEK